MKLHQSRTLLCFTLGCALATMGTAQAQTPRHRAQPPGAPASQGVDTTFSGTVSQFNYDRDGEVEGFLLSNNTLVHLPPRVSARVATSVHAGDSIEVAGLAQASGFGFRTVEARRIQDRNSGLTVAVQQPGAAAPYSGSGRIQQLNYAPNGEVNGFVFDNGALARVPPFAATNPSSLRVGATVGYSGYARNTTSERIVVEVRTLTINGQALSVNPAGRTEHAPPPPPVPGRPVAADAAGPSRQRTAEPPAPPPPPPAQNPGS